MKKYDVTFVLPVVVRHYPPGGYDVVFRLASALNKNGIKTSIIFLSNASLYVEGYQREEPANTHAQKSVIARILDMIFKLEDKFFNGNRIKLYYKIWKFIYRITGIIDYNYGILDNVDCYSYEKVEGVKFSTKAIFATHWATAYFVREFIKKNPSKPFYLVQNSEDDISFSGKNSPLAKQTYDFNFKKFVINKILFERFKSEEPHFFHVGIDTKFYNPIKPFDKRTGILFPLRKNGSKGSKYALECIEKLIKNDVKVDILAFGDFNKSEIPNSIKGKIKYYYLPKRKTLRGLYNESLIFVLPSIVEGMSLPTLEAMACGCCVIATDNGGVNEYLVDGYNGLICPVKDSQCLYDKIIYLLNNREKMAELNKNSLETAQKYSYEKMQNEFVHLLENYIRGQNS